MAEAPACPQCGSKRVWKDGLRYLNNGEVVQRYICRSCGYRFSDPNRPQKNLKTHHAINNGRCGSRVLALLEPRGEWAMKECAETGDGHAGATAKQNQAKIKGEILSFLWKLKKDGRSKETIRTYGWALNKLLEYGADLQDPESVKEALTKMKMENASKDIIVTAYSSFLKANDKTWHPPKYKRVRKLPFIPTEQEIDTLIAGCGKVTAAALQIAKETGMRIGEILRLKWTDIDVERKLIVFNEPEKHGNPRIFRISDKLLKMINSLPRKGERVFNGSRQSLVYCLNNTKKRLARKLGNPRLLQISFHTLRHWKATMEYHQTKDILHVKQLLGHKRIETTLIYVQLEEALFNEASDEFYSATAKTTSEAAKLIEAGFEYVCTTPQNVMLFRKRK